MLVANGDIKQLINESTRPLRLTTLLRSGFYHASALLLGVFELFLGRCKEYNKNLMIYGPTFLYLPTTRKRPNKESTKKIKSHSTRKL